MSVIKFWTAAFCMPFMPLYIGGSSKSKADTTTTNNTTNDVSSVDRRIVASDAAIALSGNANSVTRNESTAFTDQSNSSTNFTDYSAKDSGNSSSSTVNNTVTDFGSIAKALQLSESTASGAFDLADNSINGAIDSLNRTGDNGLAAVMGAFSLAKTVASNATATAKDTLTFANASSDKTSAAFAQAVQGPDQNKTVMYAALAVIGAVGLGIALKKG